MKYLVTTSEGPELPTEREMLDALETVVLPGLDQLQNLERAGTIVGGLPLGGRSFAFILEAESNEEVDRKLRSLPMWGVLEWDVAALQSFKGRADIEKEIAARLKSKD